MLDVAGLALLGCATLALLAALGAPGIETARSAFGAFHAALAMSVLSLLGARVVDIFRLLRQPVVTVQTSDAPVQPERQRSSDGYSRAA